MCEVVEEEEEDDDDETYEDDESVSLIEEEGEREVDGMNWWDGDFSDFRWERQAAGRWLITSNREMAFDSLRSLFGPLNELEVEQETPQEVAVRKIQAIFRGYKDRKIYHAIRSLIRLNPESYLMM